MRSTIANHSPVHRVAKYANGRVEVWLTPCIVSMPPPDSKCLLVPSNERLCGTKFSHFPVGGPTPSAPIIGERPPALTSRRQSSSSTSNVANDSISQNILYPNESVDGMITELGGSHQEFEILKCVPSIDDDGEYPIRCPTGEARRVATVGLLKQNYQYLILAVAPFWKKENWERLLFSAFSSSLQLATGILATPLLGAGTRGIPVADAARIAAQATATKFLQKCSLSFDGRINDGVDGNIIIPSEEIQELEIVRFAVQDDDIADTLDEELLNVLS